MFRRRLSERALAEMVINRWSALQQAKHQAQTVLSQRRPAKRQRHRQKLKTKPNQCEDSRGGSSTVTLKEKQQQKNN